MLKHLLRASILLLFMPLLGCSLYESNQRKAIEKNENNIVGSFSGMSENLKYYYNCVRTVEMPEFLREPLEVVETPYERLGQSVLLNVRTEPFWVAVYQHHDSQHHDYCKVYPIRTNSNLSHSEILFAARLGHNKMKLLTPKDNTSKH